MQLEVDYSCLLIQADEILSCPRSLVSVDQVLQRQVARLAKYNGTMVMLLINRHLNRVRSRNVRINDLSSIVYFGFPIPEHAHFLIIQYVIRFIAVHALVEVLESSASDP